MFFVLIIINVLFILLCSSSIGYCWYLHKFLNEQERFIKKLDSQHQFYVHMNKLDLQLWSDTQKTLKEKVQKLEFKINEIEKSIKNWIKVGKFST